VCVCVCVCVCVLEDGQLERAGRRVGGVNVPGVYVYVSHPLCVYYVCYSKAGGWERREVIERMKQRPWYRYVCVCVCV
jgi:hypothetical protein